MEGKSRETTIILAIIFVILLTAVIGFGFLSYTAYQNNNSENQENETTLSESTDIEDDTIEVSEEIQITSTPEPINQGDYNFRIEEIDSYLDRSANETLNYNFNISLFDATTTYSNVETGVKDEGLVSELMLRQATEETINFGDMNRIRIPSIGIDSPVLQGVDGETLLNQGWWLHPASFTDTNGEKILYCHRRYFGRTDPRTCWNLEKLTDNQEIITHSTDGQTYTYRVISKSIIDAENTVYIRPSTKNFLKIITCGTESGAPGGNDYRVVVLAELVE